ncbi:MAG: hypothetical protein FWD32_00245, partial [Firmicutes bacterium]|nr:hypothetical protein [Bacillota bacterium]
VKSLRRVVNRGASGEKIEIIRSVGDLMQSFDIRFCRINRELRGPFGTSQFSGKLAEAISFKESKELESYANKLADLERRFIPQYAREDVEIVK